MMKNILNKRNGLIRNADLYVLALPALIYLIIFAYLPMFGHLIAFKNFSASKGLWRSEWVGFENFRFFFLNDYWLTVTWNTIFINMLKITFGTFFAVLTAIFLNEVKSKYFKKVSQSLIFLPFFISWIVVAYITEMMLTTQGGYINKIIIALGGKPVSWYSSPQYWPAILTVIHVWKDVGRASIIYLAAISGISGEYYESAVIDGASKFQQIWNITLPLLKPTIVMLVLLAIGRIFYGDFALVFPIVGDNAILYPTTDIIDTYVFRGLRTNFSGSAAIVLWQSLMGLVTIVITNRIIKRVDSDLSLW